jgi:hypothetical protein
MPKPTKSTTHLKSNVHAIHPAPNTLGPQPPPNLGEIGRALWANVVSGYEFSDAGSIETLLSCSPFGKGLS